MKQSQNHLVAYLDILGTKRFIEEDTEHVVLNLLSDCYQEVLLAMNNFLPLSGIDDFKVKIFSDNIIIAIPSSFHNANNHHPAISLNRIITAASLFQRLLLSHNMLVRGSIVYGDLYIDDVLVWGSALIRACYLESESAIYPRVIFDSSILEIKRWLLSDTTAIPFEQLYQMRKDTDGKHFLDYLHYPCDKQVCNLIDASLVYFNGQLEREQDDKIRKKMIWHTNYLRTCVSQREVF